MAPTTTWRAAAALLALVALAGCGGAEPDEAVGDPGATTSSARAEGTTTTAAPPSNATTDTDPGGAETFGELVDDLAGTEEGQNELEQLALDLLVAPSDLAGQSYVDDGYVPLEGPNRCDVDIDAEHPPSVLVGVSLLDDEERSITEELRVYADPAEATAAFEARRIALGCGTVPGDGPDDGITFGPPTDVIAEVGGDAASEVTFAQQEHRSGVIITALVGDAVVEVEISRPDDAEPGLVDREVAAFAVGKVLAALESG